MVTSDVRTPRRVDSTPDGAGQPARLATRLTQVFAGIGALAVAWQTWAFTAWLLDGPRQIRDGRGTGDTSWDAARLVEPLAVIVFVVVTGLVIRGCLKQRRLTVDAKIGIAGLLCAWIDPLINFVHPVFFWSSNFTNVSNWCGSTPLHVNPVCGDMPEPVLTLPMFYGSILLLYAMGANKVMGAVHRRWPSLTSAQLVFATFVGACAFDLALETPLFRLDLQAMPGLNWTVVSIGSIDLHLGEMFVASFIFTTIACLRYFRDDRDRTLPDRVLDDARTPVAGVLSVLTWTGAFSAVFGVAVASYSFAGFYAEPYDLPRHLLTNICDTADSTGSAYGPCPGEPGYRPGGSGMSILEGDDRG